MPGRTAAERKPRMPGDGEEPQVARKGRGQDGAWMELFCKLQKKSKVTHAHCSKIRKYTRTRRKVTHGAVTLSSQWLPTFFQTPVQVHCVWNPLLTCPPPSLRSPLLPSLSPWSSLEHFCHPVGLTCFGFHDKRNRDPWLQLIS